MAFLHGAELEKIVSIFEKRGAFFYHACQLKDFKSYVSIGGIPSRYLLEKSNSLYTRFDTDHIDQHSGVWTKVFGNLVDFGQGFSIGTWSDGIAPTPNPYGPILLVAKPTILLKSIDVAICLRSAGGRNFNREAESLSTASEVDQLFRYKISEAPSEKHKSYLKFSKELRRDFGGKYQGDQTPSTYNPEISCTVQSEYLPFDDLEFILTDKYFMSGNRLIKLVNDVALNAHLGREIRERRYIKNRDQIISNLVDLLSKGFCSLKELSNKNDILPITNDWINRLISGNLEWQYKRFISYLEEGTLSEMRKLPPLRYL
ncbi:MAG: hypothetical protein MUD09_08545 [Desulfobacterales bacterium]|jgi:hypothetical protein|nr:hypothetical protein [Desulfobacterales bacterium]